MTKLDICDNEGWGVGQREIHYEQLRAIFHWSAQVMNCTSILISWLSWSTAWFQTALIVHLTGFLFIHFRVNIKIHHILSVYPSLSCQSPGSLVSWVRNERRKIPLDSGSFTMRLAKQASVISLSLQLVPVAPLLHFFPFFWMVTSLAEEIEGQHRCTGQRCCVKHWACMGSKFAVSYYSVLTLAFAAQKQRNLAHTPPPSSSSIATKWSSFWNYTLNAARKRIWRTTLIFNDLANEVIKWKGQAAY